MKLPHRPLTLRGRLITALLVLSFLGLAVFGVTSVMLLWHSLQGQLDNRLEHHVPVHRIFERSPRVPADYLVTIFRPGGPQTIGAPPDQFAGPRLNLATVARHAGGAPFTVRDQASSGSYWRVRAVELPGRPLVAIALPLRQQEVIRPLLVIELVVGAVVLALTGIVATVVVRFGLRPLTRIEHTAQAIAGGELDRRVDERDPRTETGRLGAALNVMLARLAAALRERERSEDRLRQFVADASHELRTPLTSIRGFAELYRRGGARTPAEVELLTGRIEAEAIRMGVLVEDLLLLARLDQERALDITDVDLLVLAADAVHDAKAREPNRPVTLAPGNGAVHVLGDEHKLRQVVTNLVTNALTHTPAGTPVCLTVHSHVWPAQAGQDGPTAPDSPVAHAGVDQLPDGPLGVLEVHDEGPGIPVEQAPQVFNRFYSVDSLGVDHLGVDHRGSSARGGSGLGLAITAAILEAHNGRIELLTASGGGTTFRVLLPLA